MYFVIIAIDICCIITSIKYYNGIISFMPILMAILSGLYSVASIATK